VPRRHGVVKRTERPPAVAVCTVLPQPPIGHSFFLAGMTHMRFSLPAGFALIHGG
jgi:hypothetical protein